MINEHPRARDRFLRAEGMAGEDDRVHYQVCRAMLESLRSFIAAMVVTPFTDAAKV